MPSVPVKCKSKDKVIKDLIPMNSLSGFIGPSTGPLADMKKFITSKFMTKLSNPPNRGVLSLVETIANGSNLKLIRHYAQMY